MKIKFGVHFLGVILISTACSEKKPVNTDDSVVQNPEYGIYQNYENPPISFELQDSIIVELPNDELIAGISFLQTDLDSNMYFFDRRQSKLISYSASGDFRWETGQEGKGPGDFESVYSMINNGDHLFVGNIQGTRIDKYNFQGELIKNYKTDRRVRFGDLEGFNSQNELIMTSSIFGESGENINFLSLSGDSAKYLRHFEIIETGLDFPEGMRVTPTISVFEDQIVSGAIQEYSIKFYNYDSTIVKEYTRDFDRMVRPGSYESGETAAIHPFGGLHAPIFHPEGHLLSVVTWPTNVSDPDDYVRKSMEGKAPKLEFQHSIDIFNADGVLLFSFEGEGLTPSIGKLEHVDHNGIIYTTAVGEEAVIYKYKLHMPESI